ncbi:pentatricopeptide repeat-containing protein At5g16860 [Elaeis guineensis]|uniref:pentatricopeptide repeat-containing protein At5g16860 n=1 Tax=Elaeis guineensis var. tenera TaxID=51953 RepID=UPI003C6DA988
MPLNLLPKARPRSRTRFFSTATPPSLPSRDLAFSSFASLLKECKSLRAARQIHQQILTHGLLSSPVSSSSASSSSTTTLGTGIVASYLAAGASTDALSMLERLCPSPVFWWNTLIRLDVNKGHLDRALFLCRCMQRVGTRPDHYTFPFVLKACGKLPSYWRGTVVHAVVCRNGFESNVFVCNALVAMYASCGAPDEAGRVFDEIVYKGIDDVISWNSVVAAHVKSGNSQLALELFAQMVKEGNNKATQQRSDIISLVNILPACASLRALAQAKEIHGYALRSGLFWDIFVGNAIIDVYAKCGMMEDACRVFNGMEVKDVVSWNVMVTGYSQNGNFCNALELFEKMHEENIPLNVVAWSAVIAGYAQRGHGQEALGVFRQMQLLGSEPNAVTIISLLSACASVGALSQGMETHAYALRKCLMTWDDDDGEGEDLMVQNALIDMYSKCRSFNAARSIFDSIPLRERNVVTWTVMIGGYAQHGDSNAALELFSQMILKASSVAPNAFTISCVLMACARLAALRFGKQIHAYVIRNRYEPAMLFVANCLIDMYSKCGEIHAAQRVFNRMPQKNAVSWTSLMTGYGMHGHGDDALRVFEEMQKVGFVPDGITFLVVLYACSHSGMVDQGLKYFHSMGGDYGVVAAAEHYACVVDLLGRAGRLNEAWETIKSMPMKATAVVWVALLSACRIHANVELAEYATARLLELESDNDGSYTLLSNIYANAGRWGDVARIRHLMKKSGIKKRPGCSWVQGKKGTATFFVGDRSHPQSQQIYAVLGTLMERIRAIGYVPQTHFALHDVDDEEKSYLLSEHSEKLALAYGILTSSPGTPIRITKNIRVCGDCHSAFTFISMIVEHEIIVRDSSRFHHFKKGSCSCGSYW